MKFINMKKRNIFQEVIIAGMLLLITQTGLAQENASAPDSLGSKGAVPGALFSVRQNENTSAVSSVSGSDLYKTPLVNLSNSFSGMFPDLP